jgi:hypothetical protein
MIAVNCATTGLVHIPVIAGSGSKSMKPTLRNAQVTYTFQVAAHWRHFG